MASITKITTEDKRLARVGGFKRKAPKKPKAGATVSSLENYIGRYNDWAKECKSRAAEGRKKDNLKKMVMGAKR